MIDVYVEMSDVYAEMDRMYAEMDMKSRETASVRLKWLSVLSCAVSVLSSVGRCGVSEEGAASCSDRHPLPSLAR